MDPAFALWLGLFALGAGALGAMLGVGGGVFLVPVLTVGFGLPVLTAVGTSLIAIAATSLGATYVYLGAGLVNPRLAAVLQSTSVAGAVAGGLLAAAVPERAIFLLFALVLLMAGLVSLAEPLFSWRRPRAPSRPPAPDRPSRASYHEQRDQHEVAYAPEHLRLGLGASLGAGLISGMLGIGGGVIQVPLMSVMMAVPVRAAIATSAMIVGAIASGSGLVFAARGLVDPIVAAPVALGVIFGSQIGAELSSRLSARALRLTLGVVLLYAAWRMLRQGIG